MKSGDLQYCRVADNVIDIVSLLMMRAWWDRLKPIQHRAGELVDLPPRPTPDTPTRRIA
jgi:hypothetical protein